MTIIKTATPQDLTEWREVSMGELKTLWAELQSRGILYNGMTWDALRARYGVENVTHRNGFYIRDNDDNPRTG